MPGGRRCPATGDPAVTTCRTWYVPTVAAATVAAVAAAAAMNQADYRAAIRVVALLMLMLAPLAVLQHYSSQGSTINRQIDGDEDSVFVVVAGVVRTTGTFSFTSGYAAFILLAPGVSALTLLFPSTPTYDPWAWILWGREIAHLDLVTEGGPSWKPLPLFFTVPFSLFGQDLAPYLWLWVARAGGLLGCVMAYRMAHRLVGGKVYGALAGVSAFAALLSSNKYVRDAALGNSEPMLAAVVLWGFERHLDGRRDQALYLGFAAALLRPEVWPFLGLYGLWLFLRNPELRVRLVLIALAIPVLWFGPELWGSGEP